MARKVFSMPNSSRLSKLWSPTRSLIGKQIKYFLPILAVAMSLASASADSLSFDFSQVDDSFTSYISTADNVLGTQFTGSVNLTQGTTYYLHIIAVNNSGAGGWGADLSLTGPFVFGNGTDAINTDDGIQYWQSANGGAIGSGWVPPTDQAILECTENSCSGTVAGENAVPNSDSYPPGMIWDPNSGGGFYRNPIYWNGQCTNCQVDFSTEITATPEPSSLLLLGTFLLGLGGTLKRKFFS